MEKVKVGVIGCGSMGRGGHVKNYAQIPEAELVAVADINPERAREVAAEFGVPHHYTDYRQMLERHALDIVSVVTPAVAHRDAAVAAFEAGANALVEKPLAMNLAEAKEIVEAARRTGKLLSMALQMRFANETPVLREFITSGKLGHVYHTRLWCGHVMSIPGHAVFHRHDQSGGGVLFSTTVHLLDTTLWVLGNPQPVRASAMSYRKVSQMKTPLVTWPGGLEACDIEDFNVGIVHFADGSTMTVESNWLTHPRSRPIGSEILGDWGVANLQPLRIELEDGKEIINATPELPPGPENGVRAFLEHFCRCVMEGRVPVYRFSEMLNVQRIMDALYASAERGQEVPVAD